MKTIKIFDCFNKEHNLNVEMIYNVTEIKVKSKTTTEIHLNHKDDNYSFATFKTDEPVNSFLTRLEQYK